MNEPSKAPVVVEVNHDEAQTVNRGVVHGEYVQSPDGQLWAFTTTAEAEVIKAADIAQEAEGE